jgi:hypothetical protein
MHAAAFVRDVEARPDSPGAGIAHRVQAKTHYFAGEFVEAVRELERALALFEPGRDDDLAVRFPPDPGVASMIYLAFASWALGEAGRAVSFVERMGARMAEFSHAPTLALGRVLGAFFSLMRGDPPRARTSVSELALRARRGRWRCGRGDGSCGRDEHGRPASPLLSSLSSLLSLSVIAAARHCAAFFELLWP